MTSAFAFLIRRSIWNTLRVRLRRLRQARYAIGSIAGLLYFVWIFGSNSRMLARSGMHGGTLEPLAAAAVFALLIGMWIWPSRKGPALGFTQAEVHHLFPAPLTRRQLVSYRIARTQLTSCVPGVMVALMTRPSGVAGWVAMIVGMSLMFGVLSLQGMLVSLSRDALARGGWVAAVRRWGPVLIFGGAAAIVVATVAYHAGEIAALPGLISQVTAIGNLLSTGAPAVVLWPARALVRVVFARDWLTLLAALAPALLLWLLSAVWVLRSDAAFEEASAEQAGRVARVLQGKPAAATKARRIKPAPFRLSETARVETALLWKNLIYVGRLQTAAVIAAIAGLLIVAVVIGMVDEEGSLNQTVASLAQIFAFLVVLQGPLQARWDLRMDLSNLAVLRTWPLRGAELVRGEALAPVVLLAGLAWALLLLAVAFGGTPFIWGESGSLGETASQTIAALVIAPPLIAVEVLILNGIAVAFPAWARVGPRTPGSFDNMGQTIVMTLLSVFLTLIALIPAWLGVGVAVVLLRLTMGWVPIVMPAALAAGILVIECWVLAELIGGMLDRTDVAAIDPA